MNEAELMSIWPREPQPGNRGAVVVLAHSNPKVRGSLAAAFRSMGYLVVEAVDGLKLVEWLADLLLTDADGLLPDLIVADGELPGRSGELLLADLRAAGWRTPFILTGVRATEAARCNGEGEGRVCLFAHRFESDDLLTAACNLLEEGKGLAHHRRPPWRRLATRASTCPAEVGPARPAPSQGSS